MLRTAPAVDQDMSLGALCKAGVIERHGAGTRVQPRFLAHAEAARVNLGSHATALGMTEVLVVALSTWRPLSADPRRAAEYLAHFMSERDQLGALRPVFPMQGLVA